MEKVRKTQTPLTRRRGLPGGSAVKNLPDNAGDVGLTSGCEDLLEEEMANHSSILAWKSPWTEEPDVLQSMGSPRVRPNLANEQQQRR